MTQTIASLTPQTAGWQFLGAEVIHLAPGERLEISSDRVETAVVLVEGDLHVHGAGLEANVSRRSVFTSLADLVYVPPGSTVGITALTSSEVALGTAPAIGRYPARIISKAEMSTEMRGGGPAVRQVASTLAAPLPAERLISYEAWVPRGAWTGWPPHRHDGQASSPYLEETYYYRFDRPVGFGFHRNVDPEAGLDDAIGIHDRSLVAVPRGYHLSTAGPAANMWILNFLAGSEEDRPKPPHLDPEETWISEDWNHNLLVLPAIPTGAGVATARLVSAWPDPGGRRLRSADLSNGWLPSMGFAR